MSKISGSGPSGTGFQPQLSSDAAEEAKDQQTANEIKNIRAKTAQIVGQRKEVADGVDQKRDAGLLAGAKDPEKQAKAAQKLAAEYLPDAQLMAEAMLKTRIDPEVALKMQQKVQSDPKLSEAVEAMRDAVALIAKDALKDFAADQANKPKPGTQADAALKPEPLQPKPQAQGADLNKPTGKPELRPEQQADSKANLRPDAGPESKPALKPELRPEPKPGDGKADTTKPDPSKQDAAKADASKPEAKADPAKTPATNEAKEAAKDASKLEQSDKSKDASDAAKAEPKNAADADKKTADVASADKSKKTDEAQLKDADKTKASGEEALAKDLEAETRTKEGVFPDYPSGMPGEVDEHGMMLVSEEVYDQADATFAEGGMTGQYMQQYRMLEAQAAAPVFNEQAFMMHGADAGSAALSGVGEGSYAMGGAGNAGGGHVEVIQSTYWATLAQYGDADLGELAFILLAETIKDISQDMRAAQKAMKTRHLINEAMRKEFADFVQHTIKLTNTNPKDPRDMEREEWTYREPVITYDENGNEVVTMVEVPVETTFSGTTLPPVEGACGEVEGETHDAEWTAQQGIPPAGMAEARQNQPYGRQPDGTFITKTSHFYVTAATVESRREMYRTKIKAMKQDMDKEMINVQKFMGLRKQVVENLTKVIKNRADEAAKQIAALRR